MNIKIGIIGLGYVGLPLAVEFGKKYPTIGFDINLHRIKNLKQGIDTTLEINKELLLSADKIKFSSDINDLKSCNIFIVTVPTPIDDAKKPDLTPLIKATQTVGKNLKKGDIVIYESTVYPGCTEEECVPILEKISNLKFNTDFFVGYSPERINPGDKQHTVTTIVKVTSGSTPEIADIVDNLYKSIIIAGTHKASCIKVAEASKVIENTQRDINIAFMNELSMIFERIGIDTHEVLEAAKTKWNFIPFTPGLVGGHCIGVDPYYLTHKAEKLGYHPEVILSGRRINDNMPVHIANRFIKLMIKSGNKIDGSRILAMGITFKENCTDIRNTKAVNVINELIDFGCNVDIFDTWANPEEVYAEYNLISMNKENEINKLYDGMIVLVNHTEFVSFDWKSKLNENAVIFDVKSTLNKCDVHGRI